MKKGLLVAFICLFAEFGYSQSRTLLYTSHGWIQLNVPTGQMPDNRPPTYIDDVIFSRARSGDSIYYLAVPPGLALKIGGDTSSFCKRMYVMGMEMNFTPDDGLNDFGAAIEVYANSGGLLSLDSGAVLQEGQVHIIGANQQSAGVEVRNSKFGYRTTHNTDWAGLRFGDDARARFINSAFQGIYLGREDSSGRYSTRGGITSLNSTFSASAFKLGDNSVDTFLNSAIKPEINNHDLDFLVGKNANFYSGNDSIVVTYGQLDFKSSGSVFKGYVSGWYINFGQEDTAHPLPNIIDGDLDILEDPGFGIIGQLKISGNLNNFMPYDGYDNDHKADVIVNNQKIFETGGIRNFRNSLSISDCAQGYCHFALEFYDNSNSRISSNIGFPIDTLVINKTGCAKVTSKNPLYVAGETKIKSGQLALDPIDSISYKLVCAGDVHISAGGGLFLTKDAKGNVANVAIGRALVDNNTATPDTTCAGLSNPYKGRIDFYRDTTSTGNPDTTQIAYTDSLINFSGSYSDNTVLLNWSVKKQVNTKSFSIEKSFDNSGFLAMSNVAATINDPNENKYSSTDNSPLKKINYYRLKIFDNQDNFYYSDTIAVTGPAEIDIRLYPNPAKDIIHLSLPNTGINTEIKIVDMKGVTIKKLKIDAGTADIPIYISQLQRGAYTIFISTGQAKKTLQFIKE